MASLVEDILQPNVGLESAVVMVGERIQELKLATQGQLLQRYRQFLPSYAQVLELEARLTEAAKEVDGLIHSIQDKFQPQVEATLAEMKDMDRQLDNLHSMAATIKHLSSFYLHVEEFKKVECESDFLAASQAMGRMVSLYEECCNSLDDPGLKQALRSQVASRRSILLGKLEKEWESMVNVKAETTLILPEEGSQHFLTILQSLHLLNGLNQVVREFGLKLEAHFIQPLLKNPGAQLKEVKTENGHFSLVIKDLDSSGSNATVLEVFANLKMLLVALYRHLDNNGEYGLQNGDFPAPPRILGLLGRQLGPALSKAVVSECLEPALHTKSQDKYSTILTAGSQFQDLLLDIGFLTTDQLDSIDSIQNMDIFVANRMCEDLLTKARAIIQKNLYETFVYEDSEKFKVPREEGVPPSQTGGGEPASLSPNLLVLRNIHHFPTCQVSTSMKELLGLIKHILEEALRESSKMGIKLLYTARHICELFCAVAPVAHRVAIQTLPQQTALFHNNCMFLGHNLLLLDHKYKTTLPSSEVTLTFADLVPKIRQLGTDAFLEQMRTHRGILLEFVARAEVLEQLADGELGLVPELERAVRQMVSHLRLLQRVWHPVLPLGVFLRAMGTLVNSCLEELISRVVKLEDIHSDGAALLVTAFTDLTDQLPPLFLGETEETATKENGLALAMQHVRLWTKFSELVRLLAASMRDIVDRWADGHGALAAVFTELEVCHLIRALFQNTERRAAALARIRHRAAPPL